MYLITKLHFNYEGVSGEEEVTSRATDNKTAPLGPHAGYLRLPLHFVQNGKTPPRRLPTQLILKRASASRSSGQWDADEYDVLENGITVGRIYHRPATPAHRRWMWASGHNGDIARAAHGYEPTREAAMAAFAKSWRREQWEERRSERREDRD